jgi:acyl-coenzyme A synthetase/AMP-(fatty) acid ligase/thioesterase domain-containing protein
MVGQERNAFILEDAQAALVVTDNRHLPLANGFEQIDVLNTDDLEFMSSPLLDKPKVTAESRACLLYTSGSTGNPKGVLQNHRNLLFIAMNYTNGFHVSHEDRLGLLFSPSVIATVRVLLLALCNGCLLSSFNLKKEGFTNLAKWVRQEEISLFISVASVFRNFTDTLTEGDNYPHIRLIRLGGEPVLPRDVDSYKKYFSDECLLVNRLGGTETGDFCWNFMDKNVQIEGHTVPLGYPIEGHEILLLDESGGEAGAGELGEITVRSAYLALEYWRRADLTKAAFLPDPEGGNKRIYRTGDLGQMLPDGQLVHRGRKDHMVKVRGYRVELPEVEVALSEIDSVSEAVVMPRKDKEGNAYLVAYLIPTSNELPTISALRRSLADTLPDYMIPSSFVMMKKFPVAQNGKINRGALPEPGSERPHIETDLVRPRTSMERELERIWIDLFEFERIGIHDNFFDLGGHSMLAVRLIAQIKKHMGKTLPLTLIFESPTIELLALRLEGRPKDLISRSMIAYRAQGTLPPFFLVPNDFGIGHFFRHLADHLGSNQPVYALELPGIDGRERPLDRFEDIASHLIDHIRQIKTQGPYYLGGDCFGAKLAYEMARQLMARGDRVGLLAVFDHPVFGWVRKPPPLKRIGMHMNKVWHLSGRERGPYLLKATSLVGQRMKLAYNRSMLSASHKRMIRAAKKASRNYRPKPYPGSMTVFRTNMDAAGFDFRNPRPPLLGWDKLVQGEVEEIEIPVAWSELIIEESLVSPIYDKPTVRVLARKLRACLDRAFQRTGASLIPHNIK